ncbi:hypothetical protein [Sorangium sp. So ce1335]|uniref:hypothetical protein n=1 Tax=Sorangium sp. So ce1335 TaxID=3133335 RepID=UPI003F6139C2
MTERELAAYVCEHVFEGSRPVLLVAHEDGSWQFLCGDSHGSDAIPRVIGMNHILEADPSLCDVLNLPDNWEAERSSVGLAWTRTRIDPPAR